MGRGLEHDITQGFLDRYHAYIPKRAYNMYMYYCYHKHHFTPVLALHDPFGVDVPLSMDIIIITTNTIDIVAKQQYPQKDVFSVPACQ